MNRLTLVGRLTRDPELRALPSGTSVCNMRLAVDGRRDDDTVFIDIATFGAQAEACARYLGQGRQVSFDGRIAYHQWEAQDGTMRSKHSGIGHVGFLDSRSRDDVGEGQANEAHAERPDEDDIPF
jgi:single-strand DNA-binding protein